MREIRFRAWDEKLKVMLTPEKDKEIKNLWSIPKSCGGIVSYPDGILMQYTGLKDKNGKEIYEGDIAIVEWYKDCRCSKFKERAEIIFYSNSWCFDMSPFYPKDRDGWLVSFKADDEFEIIGNIYENPGLLNGNN